jgi:hypothetical protein
MTTESSKPSTRIGTRRCTLLCTTASNEEMVEREYYSLIVYTRDVPRPVAGVADLCDVAGISDLR